VVDVVCGRIGVVDNAGGGLGRRVALEGLQLAGAPDASVEKFVLLRQAILLLSPPPYGFLERKEAGPMTTTSTFVHMPLGISVIKLPSQ
jgi:hypothetical protein